MTHDGSARVEIAAPAKVNLTLLVGPSRPDGFHEVFSLMAPVTLADHLTVTRDPGGGLTVLCDVCPGDDNLAARMVRELEARLERRFDVCLEIEKRIPHGAGLGGGSSDAAAAMLAVERLFGLDLSPRLRYEIAAAIGSDVAFFLWPGPQLAMGRGNVLREVELPEPLHFVIALPDLSLSTAVVYGWWDDDAELDAPVFVERSQALIEKVRRATDPDDLEALIDNDLQAVVERRHPEVRRLRERLLELDATAAAMSGSGSSVFGLFPDVERAERAVAALAPLRAWTATDLQPREVRRPSSG